MVEKTDSQGRSPLAAYIMKVDGSGYVDFAALSLSAADLAALIALFPATIGQKVKAGSLSVVLASDQDAIGISSLPALPAGANVIGHVVVDSAGNVAITALPSLPAGANVIGHVIVDSAGSVAVTALPALPAGANVIGKLGIDQTTPGTTDRVTAGGNMVTVGVEVARTGGGDVTPYTAKDVFDVAAGAGFVFAGMARVNGGSGVIVKAQLATDQKTNTARWRLHLFNAAPTYIADNAPYLTLYAGIGSRVGTIDFDACATEDPTNSTMAISQKTGNILPFVCAADATLYGILELLDGFTPASAQKITVKLTAMRN